MVQLSILMRNVLGFADAIAKQGALTKPGHMGKKYVVTGPEAISYAQIAQELSAATHDREEIDVADGDAGVVGGGVARTVWRDGDEGGRESDR
jgi:uncharacterized protein YbjT (DUF2867 family)